MSLAIKRTPLQWPPGWPVTRPDFRKSTAPFLVTKARTLSDIGEEMRLFGVTDWLISSNLGARLDGLPRADGIIKNSDSPGVALYFVLNGAVRVLANDVYSDPWDNLRSVGLALVALRSLERHGGALIMAKAVEGFALLPAPASWRHVLGFGGTDVPTMDMVERAYRAAMRGGGLTNEEMVNLNVARDAAKRELTP